MAFWAALSETSDNHDLPGPPERQKSWDARVVAAKFQSLFNSVADNESKARLLAVAAPHAGDWLKAVPSASLGLRLDNESFRVAVGFRLGSRLCSPFSCACGTQMDARGLHSLACKKGSGKQSRHASVNEVVAKAFARAGVPVVKEPSSLVPGSALRPDGALIIPWSQGRCLAWDVSCPDTVAASYVAQCALRAGAAAERAALAKQQKYQQLAATHVFTPLIFETFGPLSIDTEATIVRLGGRLIVKAEDPRERVFLFQQLSMAVQRGNVACFLGSLHQDQSV